MPKAEKKKTKRTRSRDKIILTVCFCLLSILTAGITILIACPENDLNSNTVSTDPSASIHLKPGHHYVILKKDDPYDLKSHEYNSVIYNYSPIDETEKHTMYLSIEHFGKQFMDITMKLQTFIQGFERIQKNLWEKIYNVKIDAIKGLILNIFYDIDLDRGFLKTIEEIKKLISDFELTGESLEFFNVLLRVDVYNVFSEYYVYAPDPYSGSEERIRDGLIRGLKENKIGQKIHYFMSMIPFIVLERGNKKYNQSILLGKDEKETELDFYTVKELNLLKYKITEYSIYSLFRMFSISPEGTILDYQLLTEKQLKELMMGNNKSFIEKEKKIIKEKSEKIITILFDESEVFDITEIYELYHEVSTRMLNIKEKIDLEVLDS